MKRAIIEDIPERTYAHKIAQSQLLTKMNQLDDWISNKLLSDEFERVLIF